MSNITVKGKQLLHVVEYFDSTALRGVCKLNTTNNSVVSNQLESLREEMYRSFFSSGHQGKDEHTYFLSQRIDQLVLEIMKARHGS